MKLAENTYTSRVMVNLASTSVNSGNVWNGMHQTVLAGLRFLGRQWHQ